MTTKEVLAEVMREQTWAVLDKHLDDIKRIADGVDTASNDGLIVKMVLFGLAGLLMHRRHEAENPNDEGDAQ